MKKLIILGLNIIITQIVSAMPCDTGYKCQSASGKYIVNISTCRYINRITLQSVRINKKTIAHATLGPAYDGTYNNGPLDFEIELPLTTAESNEGSSRILTIEIPAKSTTGTIKEKFVAVQPGEYKTISQEAVTCKVNN